MELVRERNQRVKERVEANKLTTAKTTAGGKVDAVASASNAVDEEEEEEKKTEGGDQVSDEAESTAAETTAAAEESKEEKAQAPPKAEEASEEELPPVKMPTVEKADEEVFRITESFAWRNYLLNDKEYKATFGSEQENFSWDRQINEELLEFHAIQEFNELKGKQFVPLAQFSEVFKLVQSKPKADSLENTVVQLTDKLKRNPEEPNSQISVVLVAGIPGSGKGRLCYALRKHFGNEMLRAYDFKMPTLESSLRYDTAEFVSEMNSFV